MHVRAVCPTRGPTGQREKRERKQEEKESRAQRRERPKDALSSFSRPGGGRRSDGLSLARSLSLFASFCSRLVSYVPNLPMRGKVRVCAGARGPENSARVSQPSIKKPPSHFSALIRLGARSPAARWLPPSPATAAARSAARATSAATATATAGGAAGAAAAAAAAAGRATGGHPHPAPSTPECRRLDQPPGRQPQPRCAGRRQGGRVPVPPLTARLIVEGGEGLARQGAGPLGVVRGHCGQVGRQGGGRGCAAPGAGRACARRPAATLLRTTPTARPLDPGVCAHEPAPRVRGRRPARRRRRLGPRIAPAPAQERGVQAGWAGGGRGGGQRGGGGGRGGGAGRQATPGQGDPVRVARRPGGRRAREGRGRRGGRPGRAGRGRLLALHRGRRRALDHARRG